MDFFERMAIVGADQVFHNPLSSEKFDEFIELLELPEGGRVLDIACGSGEFLRRVVRRWKCSGVGVDLSGPAVQEAQRGVAREGLSDAIEILHSDGARYEAAPASFDAACCVGASWVWGGLEGTLEALRALVRPGGSIIVGEPHWLVSHPSSEYLEAMGMTREQFHTHSGNVFAGDALGLRFLYAIVSSQEDWDRYEGLRTRAAERWVRDHPDHPDVAELQSHHYRDAYLRWGRDELGWAVYLFAKPE